MTCYSFNALAGVRGFGGDELVGLDAQEAAQFQCPGGRSGIRSDVRA